MHKHVQALSAKRSNFLIFLSQWLKNPMRVASVAPSGRQLGRMMATTIPKNSSQRVVELGAGTGAITEALLKHGVRPENLLAVEMNPILHDLLQQRFPTTHIARDDARNLGSLVRNCSAFPDDQVDVICSSLGLLTMPQDIQHDILCAALQVLQPQGIFVQYTYGPRPPLHPAVCEKMNLNVRCIGLAWRNIPPARVYIYSRCS